MSDEQTLDKVDGVKHAIISRQLVQVVDRILQSVIVESEKAVLEISERVQSMSNLTDAQKHSLQEAFENYYSSNESKELHSVLNDHATAMFEAAQAGDHAAVAAIAGNQEYDKARKQTKKLHDKLQELLNADVAFSAQIMPVIMALQFQDKVRQELESIIKSFNDYFDYIRGLNEVVLEMEPAIEFWKKIAKNFTNTDARRLVLQTALGPDFPIENDLIESNEANSLFF